MAFTLGELAKLTGSKVKGDERLQLNDVVSLELAGDGDISFVSNPKYKKGLNTSKASAIILTPTMQSNYSGNSLINSDPYLTFAKVVNIFHPKDKPLPSIHPSAIIAESAIVSGLANIGAHVVIEENVTINDGVLIGANSVIGKDSILEDNVMLYPNVTVYSDTQIGSNSIIHSGAVIGADGFGFALQKDKIWFKILQVGNVILGSDVEVGANTTIDRAALGSTIIEDGVKLDNQIQVGHNVRIGAHSIIAGGTVIAGSTDIGKRCQIGGAVAIAGHLLITDDVTITGRTMVIKSINKADVYSSGITADENRKWRKNAARFRRLDDMANKVKRLELALAAREEKPHE